MTRRAAKVTEHEVRRLIRAVQACGLPITGVSFDGDRVEVVIGGRDGPQVRRDSSPSTFRTLAEYESWRETIREGYPQGQA
jgi:hypothetical protein